MVQLNEYRKRPRSSRHSDFLLPLEGRQSGGAKKQKLAVGSPSSLPATKAKRDLSPTARRHKLDKENSTHHSDQQPVSILAFLKRAKTLLWKRSRQEQHHHHHHHHHQAPSTTMSDQDDDAKYKVRQDYAWAVANAKASGKPVPPKPAALLAPAAAPSRPQTTTAAQAASTSTAINPSSFYNQPHKAPPSTSSTTTATTDRYRRKSAMGTDRHKQAVRDKSSARINELRSIESRYEAARQDGFRGTIEAFADRETYRQRILQAQRNENAANGFVTDAFDPAPSLLQRRKSSSSMSRKASAASDSKGDNAASRRSSVLDQLIKDARQLGREQPPFAKPDPAKFPKFTELQEQVAALYKEARDEYDVPKKRRRKWPKRLPPNELEQVNAAFKDADFLAQVPGGEVRSKDLRKLKGLTWLNDEVVTFYAMMINHRSKRIHDEGRGSAAEKKQFKRAYAFNPFFYTTLSTKGFAGVKRWTKRVDLFAHDIVIVPINVSNSHWVCAAINVREKRFEYYDSLGGANQVVYRRLRDYLSAEHADKKKAPIDLDEWEDYWDDDVPQQENSSDCGVFTCQFMDSLSRHGDGFDFDQDNIPYLRQRMVLDIKNGSIREEEYLK